MLSNATKNHGTCALVYLVGSFLTWIKLTSHNGVIIIPSSGKRDSGESQRNADAAGPSSRSRVGSPSTEEGTDATNDIATLAASPAVIPPHPEALGPGSGPQSYYRQHTHDTSKLEILRLR